MTPSSLDQQALLQKWIQAHALGRSAPLFAPGSGRYELSREATELLEQARGELALYIMCLGNPAEGGSPLYIGKSRNVQQRWQQGHIAGLRAAANGIERSVYPSWVQVIEQASERIYLLCLTQKSVKYPPIPDFPTTVGSLEYQLIRLADDAYGDQLLNHEGKSR